MKFVEYRYEGVLPNGTFETMKGAVEPKGSITMFKGEGCGLKGCKCSDGYSISITLPRSKVGIVKGICVKFDNKKEMDKFFKEHALIGGKVEFRHFPEGE